MEDTAAGLPESTVELLRESLEVYALEKVSELGVVAVFKDEGLIGAVDMGNNAGVVAQTKAEEIVELGRELARSSSGGGNFTFVRVNYGEKDFIVVAGKNYHIGAEVIQRQR